MAAAKPAAKKSSKTPPVAIDVDDYMQKLDDPLKAELQAVRAIILGVSPAVEEGIKWNVPSFHIKEYFATISIRNKAVQVILHQGAKVTDASKTGLAITDPSGMLEWLGKDRGSVKFADMKAIKSGKSAFENILRQWIAMLP